jgi:hypothetical protein
VHGTVGYYQVAEQVIPVIVLAIVVEYRIFGVGRERGDWWASGRTLEPSERVSVLGSLFVVLICLMFLFGEFSAVQVTHDGGKASSWDDFIVGMALQLGFLLLIFVPMQPYVEDLLDRIPGLRRFKLWLWRRTGAIPKDNVQPEDEAEAGGPKA